MCEYVSVIPNVSTKLLDKHTKPEDVLEPWTLGLMDLAKTRGPDACVRRAVKTFGDVSARLDKMLQSYDVILSPVMRMPPFPIGWHAPMIEFKKARSPCCG